MQTIRKIVETDDIPLYKYEKELKNRAKDFIFNSDAFIFKQEELFFSWKMMNSLALAKMMYELCIEFGGKIHILNKETVIEYDIDKLNFIRTVII